MKDLIAFAYELIELYVKTKRFKEYEENRVKRFESAFNEKDKEKHHRNFVQYLRDFVEELVPEGQRTEVNSIINRKSKEV